VFASRVLSRDAMNELYFAHWWTNAEYDTTQNKDQYITARDTTYTETSFAFADLAPC
jgi:hypothetical protein